MLTSYKNFRSASPISVTLLAEGFDQHISKGYIYFAMAFSVFVEMLNLKLRGSHPVKLHEAVVENDAAPAIGEKVE